jgi:hypothetical protein
MTIIEILDGLAELGRLRLERERRQAELQNMKVESIPQQDEVSENQGDTI